MSTRAYGYARVSSRTQTEGHGFERQEDSIRAFAAGHDLEIVRIFQDAHTGTELDRAGLTELLQAVIDNGVHVVVAESLDRVARDLTIQTAILARLIAADVTLYAASTGQNVTSDIRSDPMREAIVLVQGVFAQLEKKLLVRKLAKARAAKRLAVGRCEGRLAFGLRPGEDAVLARLLAFRREGMSLRAIAARLNDEGVPTRTGVKWGLSTVAQIAARALR